MRSTDQETMVQLVMGIDPGTATTGYGLVQEEAGHLQCVGFGVVTTPAGAPLEVRLDSIYRDLLAVLQQYKPTTAAVEKLFFHRNVTSAMAVGQGMGVALLAVAHFGLGAAEYSPLQVKQAVTGYGKASKSQVQHMVAALLSLESIPRPDDAADALAVAICHAHAAKTVEIIGTQS